MAQYGWKNCPDATRGQVSRLTSALRNRLEKDFLGIYLHGSLAMNCFNPKRSDVDLLGVVRTNLIVDVQKSITEDLLILSKAPTPIEISLLRSADLHPWQYPTPYLFHYGEAHRERFIQEISDGTWRNWNEIPKFDEDLAAHITVTRVRGVCLWGEPIEKIFPEIPRSDYLKSILADLDWADQYIESNPVYPILNACRVLVYLREGKIYSKDEAGRWAIENLPSTFLPVTRSAMSVYSGLYEDMFVPEDKVRQFIIAIRTEIQKALPSLN